MYGHWESERKLVAWIISATFIATTQSIKCHEFSNSLMRMNKALRWLEVKGILWGIQGKRTPTFTLHYQSDFF